MNQYLVQLLQRWQMRGAVPEAEPLFGRTGWLLTLCFRARLNAWLICLLFVGCLIGVLVMQVVAPQPRRMFLVETTAFAIFAAMAGYYLVFVYWYRVEVDEQALTLYRFLLPTRQIRWNDVISFEYKTGDELLKIRSRDAPKISMYLSLNGLSAVRRCLAMLTPEECLAISWASTDPVLMAEAPAWRCVNRDLEGSPFDPLTRDGDVRYAEV